MKKLLTMLMAAIMLISMATTALAAEGTDFTIEESSGYTYEDNVLTITAEGEYNIGMAAGVGTTADTIVVADSIDVTLNFDNVKIDASSDSVDVYAIKGGSGKLTINGTLDVTATSTGGSAYGIYSSGDIEISGGTINVNASSTYDANGIYAYSSGSGTANVTISGSAVVDVVATGTTSAINGIYAYNSSDGDAKVEISGSAVVNVAANGTTGNTYGIYASSNIGDAKVEISGSAVVNVVVVITNGDVVNGIGIYAKSDNVQGTVTISGATVNVTTSITGDNAYGIYGYDKVDIKENAAVSVIATNTRSNAYGIYTSSGTDTISIANSAVNTIASATATVYGINAGGELTIDDYSSVKAYGTSAAVYAGTATATAPADTSSFTIKGGASDYTSNDLTWDSTTYKYSTTTAKYLLIAPGSGSTFSSVYSVSDGTYTETDTQLTISAAGTYNISFAENINATVKPIVITADGDVTLNFTDVKIASNSSAINASSMSSGDLTITGTLDATTGTTASGYAYAINATGNLTIEGTVNALAGSTSAVCCINSSSGTITISKDATVNALANSTSSSAYGIRENSGDISISGTVNALANSTGTSSTVYGIYAANSGSSSTASISISGTVNANANTTGSGAANGIYANNSQSSGTSKIEITGGTVNANANSNSGTTYGIYANSSGTSTITITGENTVVNVTANTSGAVYGIYSYCGAITISDNATVNVTANASSSAYGIYTKSGNITITGTVNVTANASSSAYGIYTLTSGAISITGGTVNVTANSTSSSANGIYGATGYVSITGTGTKVNVTANGSGSSNPTYGIYSLTSVTISEGAAVNTFVTSNEKDAYGIYAEGEVSISDGATVNATATSDSGNAYGIYAVSDKVEISGENTIVNTKATSTGGSAYGIYAKTTSTISGGEVTANATSTSGSARGITVTADLTISGSDTVVNATANGSGLTYGIWAQNGSITGGTVSVNATSTTNNAHGIFGYYTITISGGTVDATAKIADNKTAYGISTQTGNVTISGGTVNATGTADNTEVNGTYGINAGANVSISGAADVTAQASGSATSKYAIYAYGTLSVVDTLIAKGYGTEDYDQDVTIDTTGKYYVEGTVNTGTDVVTNIHIYPTIPQIAIDYVNETFTGFGSSNYQYYDGSEWQTLASGTAIDSTWFNTSIQIRFEEGGAMAAGTAEQILEIPARPTAPTPSNDGSGVVSNIDTSMEYSEDSITWTAITDSTITLYNGTYQFRIAAVADTSFASENVTVEITDNAVPSTSTSSSSSSSSYSYKNTVTEADGGSISVSSSSAKAGKTVTITVIPEDGYQVGEVLVDGGDVTVTDNGDGTYSYVQPSNSVEIEVIFEEIESTETEEETETETSKFLDVIEDSWYEEYVEAAVEAGIMQGNSSTEFDPNGTTTRAMMVKVLHNINGGDVVNYLMTFDDISGDEWYGESVRWASAEGIVLGISETEFAANNNITREQLVTMLYRYAVAKGVDVSVGEDTNILSYNDALSISEYAIEAFQWACGAGIINGDTDGNLNPQASATRAELAKIMVSYLGL